MTEITRVALDRVRSLMREHQFDAACDALREAREQLRAQGNNSAESFLTSLLVSHLSAAGHDEAAVEECLRAEAANPDDRDLQMLTVRQMLRAGDKREARLRSERLLGEINGEAAEERHRLLSSLGECVVEENLPLAHARLQEALRVALDAGLDPANWNRSLALQLWQRGDAFGWEYLRRLGDIAEKYGDEATRLEVQAFLSNTDELTES